METINVFESPEFLDPKCPKCQSKIEYGVTTKWNDQEEAHVCKNCGTVLK